MPQQPQQQLPTHGGDLHNLVSILPMMGSLGNNPRPYTKHLGTATTKLSKVKRMNQNNLLEVCTTLKATGEAVTNFCSGDYSMAISALLEVVKPGLLKRLLQEAERLCTGVIISQDGWLALCRDLILAFGRQQAGGVRDVFVALADSLAEGFRELVSPIPKAMDVQTLESSYTILSELEEARNWMVMTLQMPPTVMAVFPTSLAKQFLDLLPPEVSLTGNIAGLQDLFNKAREFMRRRMLTTAEPIQSSRASRPEGKEQGEEQASSNKRRRQSAAHEGSETQTSTQRPAKRGAPATQGSTTQHPIGQTQSPSRQRPDTRRRPAALQQTETCRSWKRFGWCKDGTSCLRPHDVIDNCSKRRCRSDQGESDHLFKDCPLPSDGCKLCGEQTHEAWACHKHK